MAAKYTGDDTRMLWGNQWEKIDEGGLFGKQERRGELHSIITKYGTGVQVVAVVNVDLSFDEDDVTDAYATWQAVKSLGEETLINFVDQVIFMTILNFHLEEAQPRQQPFLNPLNPVYRLKIRSDAILLIHHSDLRLCRPRGEGIFKIDNDLSDISDFMFFDLELVLRIQERDGIDDWNKCKIKRRRYKVKEVHKNETDICCFSPGSFVDLGIERCNGGESIFSWNKRNPEIGGFEIMDVRPPFPLKVVELESRFRFDGPSPLPPLNRADEEPIRSIGKGLPFFKILK